MTARRPLPNRRASAIETIEVAGQRYGVGIGLYEDGAPGEIFISGAKSGSHLDALASDGAVAVSLGLQYGIPVEVLRHSMTRLPAELDGPATAPASIVGAALDLLARR